VATASQKYAPQSYSEKIYYAITMGGQTKTVDGRVPTIRRPGVTQGYVPESVTRATGVKPEDVTRTTQQIQTRAPTATTKTVTTAVQNTIERNLATQNLALKRMEAAVMSRFGSTGKVTQTVQQSASTDLVKALVEGAANVGQKIADAFAQMAKFFDPRIKTSQEKAKEEAERIARQEKDKKNSQTHDMLLQELEQLRKWANRVYDKETSTRSKLNKLYTKIRTLDLEGKIPLEEFTLPEGRLARLLQEVAGADHSAYLDRTSAYSFIDGTRNYMILNPVTDYYVEQSVKRVSETKDKVREFEDSVERFARLVAMLENYVESYQAGKKPGPQETIVKLPPKSGEEKKIEGTTPKDIPVTDVDINELKRRKDSIMKELDQARTNRIIMSKRLEDLRSRISSLEAMIPSLQQMRDRLTAELNDLLSRAQTAVSETADSIMAKISAVEQEVAGLRAQRSQLQSQIQQLESIVSELRERLSQAGISMQLRYRYAISIRRPGVTQGGYIARTTGVTVPDRVTSAADLSKLKEQLRADISREESELSGIRSELQSLASQIAPLESRLTNLSSARAALEDEIKSLQQRVEELRRRVVDSTPGDLKSLQSRLQSLLSERDRLLSEVNNLIARAQSLLSEKSSLESMLSGLGLPRPPTIEIPPITPPITPEVPTIPPLTIPQIPTLPPTIPQTPSADIQMLLQQFQNMQQQMMNQLATMMQLQQRAPYDPTAQMMLQQLQAERAMLMQQIQSLQQQLLMASQQRPQDVSLPVLMMLVSQMQNQSRGIEQYLPVIFQMMMESRSSTERDALRDYIDQLNRERAMLQAQIAMLQQQIESLKAAPPAPPAPPKPAWYPGMIITSILGAIFGRAG
jgi:ABC-type transporter Mla subunit MlaD